MLGDLRTVADLQLLATQPAATDVLGCRRTQNSLKPYVRPLPARSSAWPFRGTWGSQAIFRRMVEAEILGRGTSRPTRNLHRRRESLDHLDFSCRITRLGAVATTFACLPQGLFFSTPGTGAFSRRTFTP